MRVVPGSCSLELVPAQASSSLHIHARFTMKPDLSQPSIIGQTAHNLDEVSLSPEPCTGQQQPAHPPILQHEA